MQGHHHHHHPALCKLKSGRPMTNMLKHDMATPELLVGVAISGLSVLVMGRPDLSFVFGDCKAHKRRNNDSRTARAALASA